MMTRDHVIWAGALRVEEQFGDQGFDFVDKRIEDLINNSDANGVKMSCKIGEALSWLGYPSELVH